MAEWLKAAVLKTVEGHTSGGSNPSLPATHDYLLFLDFLLKIYHIDNIIYKNHELQKIHMRDIFSYSFLTPQLFVIDCRLRK